MDWDTRDNDIVECVERLFALHGRQPGEAGRREPVTALAHALQCAQLAEWAHADDALVAAAFLHDVGRLLAAGEAAPDDALDDRHEVLALPLLSAHFGPDITEPIRLHVQAKRFLVTADSAYAAGLSAASRHSLAFRGGPMAAGEASAFMAQRHARAALQLRRWDDLAKEPGGSTPSMDHYLALLDDLRRRPLAAARTPVGAVDAV